MDQFGIDVDILCTMFVVLPTIESLPLDLHEMWHLWGKTQATDMTANKD